MAKKLEDLLIYQKALEGAELISALLKRPAFGKDCELKTNWRMLPEESPGTSARGSAS
jgi:hypothetical protein